MNTYIALYTSKHKSITTNEHSCFIWQQESGDIDLEMLKGKIIRERSLHFFNLIDDSNAVLNFNEISVNIEKTEVFKG